MILNDYTPGRPLRLYTKNQTHIDMSTDSIVGLEINKYKDWLCGMGKENIYIDMDGKIFGASCRQGGQFGNIYEDIVVPNAWVICKQKLCSCGADLFIPKMRSAEDKVILAKTFPKQNEKWTSRHRAKADEEFVAMERTHDAHLRQVYWELGRWCNYDCSYCWPFIHNKTDPHKSLEQLIRGCMLVEEKFALGQRCHYVISGGEPTMNPALLDWVKFIYSLGHKISMHSNGSRLPDYYKELIHYTNLNLSVHFEFYKKERLLSVIESVVQEKVLHKNQGVGHFEVKLMMSPGRTAEALELETQIFNIPNFKKYCVLAIVPIRDGNRGDLIKEGYKSEDFLLFGDRN